MWNFWKKNSVDELQKNLADEDRKFGVKDN